MPPVTMLRSLLALLTLTTAATLALGQAAPPIRPPLPPDIAQPRFVVPNASQPLRLQRVDVQTVLAGSQAQTRIELVVHNPNPRVLEATLEFPLADGQGVAGFALDINGELVSAVPVPKDKGRQVFDDRPAHPFSTAGHQRRQAGFGHLSTFTFTGRRSRPTG